MDYGIKMDNEILKNEARSKPLSPNDKRNYGVTKHYMTNQADSCNVSTNSNVTSTYLLENIKPI